MQETSLIILAAGASTRLGQPKQQVPYAGCSLLQRAVQSGLSSRCTEVIVVLGARYEQLLPSLNQNENLKIMRNTHWEQGMGTSVSCGMQGVSSRAAAVILMVCDQPFVDAALLNTLLDTQAATGKSIVASAYGNTRGTPVLFTDRHFQELRALNGREGARKLLFKYDDEVASVPFPEGAIDIDTPADVAALQQFEQQRT